MPVVFYASWNALAQNAADQVAQGAYTVNPLEYAAFMETKRLGLEALGKRLALVRTDDLLASFDSEVLDLTKVTFVQGLAAGLLSLVGAVVFWGQANQIFHDKLAVADMLLMATDAATRLGLAFSWAWENGYFGAAAAEIVTAILNQGWEILGTVALFIAIQFVPILDVAVDTIVIIHSGIDALRALAALVNLFGQVLDSASVVDLQRNSAQMAAGLEGEGLRILLDILAIVGSAGAIKAKAAKIRVENPGISEDQALQKALEESEEGRLVRQARAAQDFLAANGNSNTARLALSNARGVVSDAEQLLLAMNGDATADLAVVDRCLLNMAAEDQRAALLEVLSGEGSSLPFRQRLLNSSQNFVELIVAKRGYPFGFGSLGHFEAFKLRVRSALEEFGMPSGDVRVHGSSVSAKATPPDIDVAVIVDRAEYDAVTDSVRRGIRHPGVLESFEAQAPGGHINSFFFKRIPGRPSFNQLIYGSSNTDTIQVSIVLKGGPFDQGPYLAF